jgi:hypothetical protein
VNFDQLRERVTGVLPLQASNQSVKIVVPDTIKWGVYKVRISTDEGSNTWLLNSPTVYWAQGNEGDSASPGGWIRIFGRCLHQLPKMSLLRMTDVESQKSRQLEVKSGSLWETSFDIPTDMKPGIYELQLQSGWGDNSIWTYVGRLEV